MPEINWDSDSVKSAGMYSAEVGGCVLKFGKVSGSPYFQVTFNDTADGSFLCTDIISFSPRAVRMMIAKLKALGVQRNQQHIEAEELIGRRCRIAVKVEAHEEYGPRLVVDISTKAGFCFGYKEATDDDLPF